MGDGSDGSDGASGDSGGGGGGFDFSQFDSVPTSSFDQGGLASMYSEDDPNNPYRNRQYQGHGFDQNKPGDWQMAGSYIKPSAGVDATGGVGWGGTNFDQLHSIGYNGTMQPVAQGSGENMQGVFQPEYEKFLADNHINQATRSLGNGNNVSQYFQNGNPLGQQYNWNYDRDFGGDSTFGQAVGLAASAFGGFGAGQLAAGAGYGAGTAIGGAATGAGAGFMGAASQTGDFGSALKGAAVGGLTGGAIGAANVPGMVGVTDPTYSKAINGALGAGTKSAIGGGNIGSSVLSSLAGSGISAGGNAALGAMMGDDYNADYGHEGGNSLASNGFAAPSDQYPQGGYSQAPQQSTFDRLSGVQAPDVNYSQAPGVNPDNPNMGSVTQYMGQGSAPNKQEQGSGNPVVGMLKSGAQMLGGGFQPGKMDNMGANLMDLYSRYKGYRNQSDLAGNLSSMYGPNSAYAKQMESNLSRMGAARGTRSQVGARSVALQAALADANSRNAPVLAGIYGNMDKARMGMGSDAYRMLAGGPNGGGGMGMLRDAGNSLQNYFSQPGGGVQGYNPASDYNYQNGSDLGGFADGGPVRSGDPVVGTRGPVRSGGGGGLSPDAVRQAVIRSAAPASSPNTYVNPMNPASVNAYREQQAGTYARGGAVYGPGGPRTDSIPARLSNGEHVMDARSVNALGGGNNEQGQAVLNQLRMRLHRS